MGLQPGKLFVSAVLYHDTGLGVREKETTHACEDVQRERKNSLWPLLVTMHCSVGCPCTILTLLGRRSSRAQLKNILYIVRQWVTVRLVQLRTSTLGRLLPQMWRLRLRCVVQLRIGSWNDLSSQVRSQGFTEPIFSCLRSRFLGEREHELEFLRW